MSRQLKNQIAFWGAVAVMVLVTLCTAKQVRAHDINIDKSVTNITNNYITETPSITRGIAGDELAKGLTGAVAAGSHQFDYVTTRWQLSLTGGVEFTSEERNYSIAIGKRFGKDSWIPNALFHGSYTPIESRSYWGFGVTIPLGD